MDSIVTARIPSGIKEQGKDVLDSIGATPTELINAAYRYLIAEHKLPKIDKGPFDGISKGRKLLPDQKAMVKHLLEDIPFSIPQSYWDGITDEEALEEALREKYV